MELIDIVNENNELTGEVEERWKAIEKGYGEELFLAG